MIARRIREMMGSGYIYDKDSDSFRKIQYKDIVILTRSIQGWAEIFSAVLAEEGIPAYSVSREGYFETYEISVLLDYLRILDNARQDLPLTAVLTSPFVGLDAEELAQIRLAYPNLPFYESVWLCGEEKRKKPEQTGVEKPEKKKRKKRKNQMQKRKTAAERFQKRSEKKAGRVYEAGQILQKHTFLYSIHEFARQRSLKRQDTGLLLLRCREESSGSQSGEC